MSTQGTGVAASGVRGSRASRVSVSPARDDDDDVDEVEDDYFTVDHAVDMRHRKPFQLAAVGLPTSEAEVVEFLEGFREDKITISQKYTSKSVYGKGSIKLVRTLLSVAPVGSAERDSLSAVVNSVVNREVAHKKAVFAKKINRDIDKFEEEVDVLCAKWKGTEKAKKIMVHPFKAQAKRYFDAAADEYERRVRARMAETTAEAGVVGSSGSESDESGSDSDEE